MDNPLAEIDRWWNAAAPDDGNAYTRFIELKTAGDGYHLEFGTVDEADAEALWHLAVMDVEEVAWRGAGGGDPVWDAEHPLLLPCTASHAILSFAKPLDDPLRAWGAVAQAHRALVGDWFPLERFFSTGLLEGRFGMLASGPETLLDAYADALRSVGEEVGLAPHDQPWRAKDPPPSVVTWGESYFVARRFRLERTA